MLRLLSLFSGCGGMDLGFEGNFDVFREEVNFRIHPEWDIHKPNKGQVRLPTTIFKTVFANDILPAARSAWINYFTKRDLNNQENYQLQSIVDIVKSWEAGSKFVIPQNIDIVTGGFPCQDFSVAGKRRGFHSTMSHDGHRITPDEPNIETRGQLYMWMKNVIEITKPKIFIAENVKGLVSLSDVKSIIEHDFRNIGNNGYLVVPARVLLAANFGVPQSRERVIFIGLRKNALTEQALRELTKEHISSEYDPYPIQTHAETPKGGLLPWVTLRKIFRDLPEPNNATDSAQKSYSKAKYLGKHLQGQSEINLDGIGPTIRSEHHGNIEYRRLSIEHGGKYIEELNEGKAERRLTVRECARIQTFPDDYEFVYANGIQGTSVSASNAYKIIGNAVPPLLAYHIARRLQENWERYFGERPWGTR